MPVREPSWTPAVERWGDRLGLFVRRARVQSKRLGELLEAARTPEGRQRNLAPLLVLFFSASFLIGAGIGLSRKRSR